MKLVKSEEDFNDLKYEEPFQFYCRGNHESPVLVTMKFKERNEKNMNRYKTFLCRDCFMKLTISKRTVPIKTGYTPSPEEVDLEVGYDETFDNFKRGDTFKFKCRNPECDKYMVIASFRKDRIERYKSFLCEDCYRTRNSLERWGTERPMQNEKVKKIVVDKLIELHGKPTWMTYGSDEWKKLMEERLGVDHPSKSKEILNIKKKNYLDKTDGKYESPFQNPEVIQKGKDTKIEEHGDPNWNNREQFAKTMLELTDGKYTTPLQTPEAREANKIALSNPEVDAKRRKTCSERYDNEYCIASKHCRDLARKTIKEKYKCEYATQNPEVKKKILENKKNCRYYYMGQTFDSGWELYFFIYCTDHCIPIQRNYEFYIEYDFEYEDNGKIIKDKGHYFPDFFDGDKYIEIKGTQYYRKLPNGEIEIYDPTNDDYYHNIKINAKFKCMKDNEDIVKVADLKTIHECEKYVNNTYGKDYIDRFAIDKNIDTSCFTNIFMNLAFTNSLLENYYKFCFSNNFYGYTPFDIDKNSEYSDPCYTENGGLGLTPFDV